MLFASALSQQQQQVLFSTVQYVKQTQFSVALELSVIDDVDRCEKRRENSAKHPNVQSLQKDINI